MELRERIIQEATALFFRNGIKSITMSDIANELGISKRTLYEVFRDKDELLEACINTKMAIEDAEIESIANSSDNVIDVLMLLYANFLRSAHEVNKTVVHDLKKYHAHIHSKIECRQKDVYHSFIPLIQKGIDEGLIRKDTNFEIIMWLVRAQFKALIEDDFIPTDKYTIKEFILAIILNFIHGIATQAGNEIVDRFVTNMNRA